MEAVEAELLEAKATIAELQEQLRSQRGGATTTREEDREIVNRLQQCDELKRLAWKAAIRRTVETVAKRIQFERVSVFRNVFEAGEIIGVYLGDSHAVVSFSR